MITDKSSIVIIMCGMIAPFALWCFVSFIWAYFEVCEDEKRKEAKQKEKKIEKKKRKNGKKKIPDDYNNN